MTTWKQQCRSAFALSFCPSLRRYSLMSEQPSLLREEVLHEMATTSSPLCAQQLSPWQGLQVNFAAACHEPCLRRGFEPTQGESPPRSPSAPGVAAPCRSRSSDTTLSPTSPLVGSYKAQRPRSATVAYDHSRPKSSTSFVRDIFGIHLAGQVHWNRAFGQRRSWLPMLPCATDSTC